MLASHGMSDERREKYAGIKAGYRQGHWGTSGYSLSFSFAPAFVKTSLSLTNRNTATAV
jgi:hypothetical protein